METAKDNHINLPSVCGGQYLSHSVKNSFHLIVNTNSDISLL